MDPQQKKISLRNITYGVYVMTVKSGNDYAAAMVTWVSQASLNPPKIMLGLKRESKTTELVKETQMFVLNILGENQKPMAKAFLKHANVDGTKLNGYTFYTGETGAPILSDAPSFLECKIKNIVEGPDHDVVVAEVVNAGVHSDEQPLALRSTGWSYGG